MKIFTGIYDKVACCYIHTAMEVNDAVAVRNFSDLVNRDKNMVSTHPQDYRLDRICKFDELTGDVLPDKATLIEAQSCIVPDEPEA